MGSKVHVSKVGTYHPAPDVSKPWVSVAHCSICGWAGTEWARMDRALAAECSKNQADNHTLATGHSDVVTYTNRESISPAWTINDTRGTIDGGPACDECGACECAHVKGCKARHSLECECHLDGECIGLSFAFICLDGGETLCEECAAKAGVVIVPCDCE